MFIIVTEMGFRLVEAILLVEEIKLASYERGGDGHGNPNGDPDGLALMSTISLSKAGECDVMINFPWAVGSNHKG